MIDGTALRSMIAGDNRSWGGRPSNPQALVQNIDKMSDRDVVRVIDDSGYDHGLFAWVINHAPHRVPGIIAGQKYRTGYHRSEKHQWDKFDWKNLDKDKTFEALEYVWANKDVPEGLKDDFTLKVFKRFKPPAAKLMQMLKSADSQFATEYVLKKTKNPSEELLNYVVDEFPGLIGEAKTISDSVLIKLFKDQYRYAVGLMNCNLRGYGRESRSRWETPDIHQRLDPSSNEFEKFKTAAYAAGKKTEFDQYVVQAQLDDQVRRGDFNTYSGEGDNLKRGHIDFAKVAEHINDFSLGTLIKIAQSEDDGVDKDKLIDFYFKKLTKKTSKTCRKWFV